MADEWPRVLCRLGFSSDMVSEKQLLEQRFSRAGTTDRHKGVALVKRTGRAGLRFHRDAGIKSAIVWSLCFDMTMIRHEDRAEADYGHAVWAELRAEEVDPTRLQDSHYN